MLRLNFKPNPARDESSFAIFECLLRGSGVLKISPQYWSGQCSYLPSCFSLFLSLCLCTVCQDPINSHSSRGERRRSAATLEEARKTDTTNSGSSRLAIADRRRANRPFLVFYETRHVNTWATDDGQDTKQSFLMKYWLFNLFSRSLDSSYIVNNLINSSHSDKVPTGMFLTAGALRDGFVMKRALRALTASFKGQLGWWLSTESCWWSDAVKWHRTREVDVCFVFQS